MTRHLLLMMEQQEKAIRLGRVVDFHHSFVMTGKYAIGYFTGEAMMSRPEAQLLSIFRLLVLGAPPPLPTPTPLHLSRRLSALPQIICRCVPVRACALTQVAGCLPQSGQ